MKQVIRNKEKGSFRRCSDGVKANANGTFDTGHYSLEYAKSTEAFGCIVSSMLEPDHRPMIFEVGGFVDVRCKVEGIDQCRVTRLVMMGPDVTFVYCTGRSGIKFMCPHIGRKYRADNMTEKLRAHRQSVTRKIYSQQ